MRSPYRSAAAPEDVRDARDAALGHDDRELLPVFAVGWVASVFRLLVCVRSEQPMSCDVALALLGAVFGPVLVWQPTVGLVRELAARARIKKR